MFFFMLDSMKQGRKEVSTRKTRKTIYGRRQTLKLTTSEPCETQGLNQPPYYTVAPKCGKSTWCVQKALPVDDGRARSIVLALEIHICWNVLKKKKRIRIDPSIRTQNCLSGGATTLIFIVAGGNSVGYCVMCSPISWNMVVPLSGVIPRLVRVTAQHSQTNTIDTRT